jgi:hypothetical protein
MYIHATPVKWTYWASWDLVVFMKNVSNILTAVKNDYSENLKAPMT